MNNSASDQAQPLTRDWRLWVAENALRDCDKPSMVQTMVQAGVPKADASNGVDDVLNDACFEAARKHQQITQKYASFILNHQLLLEQNPNYSEIERRENVGKEEFFEKYYLANRPVIITDFAKNWPAMQLWSLTYFKEKFGKFEVQVQMNREADSRYEENKPEHCRYLSMKNLVERIEVLDNSNDVYLTANNDGLQNSNLVGLFDDIGSLPDYLDPGLLRRDCSLWIGPAGTVTPLHHDPVNLFHLQVTGRKRWRLIPSMQLPLVYNFNSVFSPVDMDAPDFARYPLFRDVSVFDVVIEPGEAIFLPLAWWHQVESLDTCISLSFSNLIFRNYFEYVNPNIKNWY